MAMDKTTTRRMIGAIVLVLVASLVLAYLLKSKNNQPDSERIHDVTLPSSPILAFPGNENIQGVAPTQGNAATTDKAGLDIVPNLQPKSIISGQQAAAEQAKQAEQKKEQVKVAAEKSQKAEEKKAKEALKKADVVKLDNKDKVSTHKAPEKKSHDKPKLVGEKKLPKYQDKPKQVKKDKPAPKKTVKADNPDAIPSTGYSIQLLATKREKKAKDLKDLMVSEGYPAYIAPVSIGGKTLYRVRIGSYQERDEANNAQDRMKNRYLKNLSVQNSLVRENKQQTD